MTPLNELSFFKRGSLVVLLLGLLGLALGVAGIRSAVAAQHLAISNMNALYYALQLFVLGGGHYDDVGTALHVARFLCPLVTSTALVRLFHAGGKWWRPYVKKTLGNHVIIVGPGKVADALVARAKSEGRRTLLIMRPERAMEHGEGTGSDDSRMMGNIGSEAFMRSCGGDRASHVLAVSDFDGDNLSVTAAMSNVHSTVTDQVRVVRVQSGTARLGLEHGRGQLEGVQVASLDLAERRARDLFSKHRLDHHPGGAATLLIIGHGAVAQSLAVHAGRVAHYLDRPQTRLVWVSPGGKSDFKAFYRRWQFLGEVLTITHVAGQPGDQRLAAALVQQVEQAEESSAPMLFALLDGERFDDCLGAALWVEKICTPDNDSPELQKLVRIVPDLSSQPEMRAMAMGPEFRKKHPRIAPYSERPLEESLDLSAVDQVDRLAKELHMLYFIKRDAVENKEGQHEPRDAEQEWSKLDEIYRVSNRALADHLNIKLASAGLELVPAAEGEAPLPALSDEWVESLAQLEHVRWMAERRVAGWTPADARGRDNRKQRHDLMIPWDNLAPKDKDLDRANVDPSNHLLKHALAKAGLGVRARKERAERPLATLEP